MRVCSVCDGKMLMVANVLLPVFRALRLISMDVYVNGSSDSLTLHNAFLYVLNGIVANDDNKILLMLVLEVEFPCMRLL